MLYKHFVNTVDDYVKCHPTIAEMKSRLHGKPYRECFSELTEKGLLNPLEITDYMNLIDILENGKTDYAGRPIPDSEIWDQWAETQKYGRIIDTDNIPEELFQYNRRLIEGLKEKPAPTVKEEDYIKETYDGSPITTIGEIEQTQVEMQEKETFPPGMVNNIKNHFAGRLDNVNNWVRHGGYVGAVSKNAKESYRDIRKAANQTSGLLRDTYLSRGGPLENIHLKPGDHARFKGATSTSFNPSLGRNFKTNRSYYFEYRIYAPAGTKGLCCNADPFPKITAEHEYLLPPGTGYTVKDIDYDERIIEVVLDEN